MPPVAPGIENATVPDALPSGPMNRFARLQERWGRLFWTLHSTWALLTGAAVLVLARNRYGYVPWVVLFLALTWASTLFFSRVAPHAVSPAGLFARGFVSYLTRVMYQETLFFLLPFYMYSTTVPSANALYTLLLASVAVLSCLDIPFDRLLQRSRAFALAFFFLVAFSALQLVLPLGVHLPGHWSSELAAGGAFASAVPLAGGLSKWRRPRCLLRLAGGLMAILVAVRVLLPLIPPVPLRVTKVRFAAELDRVSKRAPRDFSEVMSLSELGRGELYAVATVFAPTPLSRTMVLSLAREGAVLRRSQEIHLVANPHGFRIWDVVRAPAGGFAPGRYTLTVNTREGQLVGRASLDLVDFGLVARPRRP